MARPDYYDPAECETHETGAPKFCKKSEPGEGTERSCAYDGARVVLMPITDVIHLVHGPIACAGNSWDNRGARSSGSQLYRRGFTTEMLHNDVVFGGEKKLHRAIVELAGRYPEAKAVFVYATCVTAMTGDDVEAVCRAAAKEVAIPVIPVNTPGFIGDKNIGNRLAGEILLDCVIGTAEPEVTTPYDVNLIGEYNIAGDLWGMLPLFERLGIRILSCVSRRRALRGSAPRPPREAERHHLLEEPHEPRAEDEEALGHPVPRGVVLRDDRHREGAPRHRAGAGPRERRRRGPDDARPGRGAGRTTRRRAAAPGSPRTARGSRGSAGSSSPAA